MALPWPGLSACTAPQNMATSSETTTTPIDRLSREMSSAKPFSVLSDTRTGEARSPPPESAGGGPASVPGVSSGGGLPHVERALQEILG